jgi:Ca2+-binding EF-hand superfamily protein
VSHPFLFVAAIAATAATPGHAAAFPASQLLGAVQAAAAAPSAPPKRTDVISNANGRFRELDTNKDGSLTKAEVDAAQARAQQRASAAIQQQVTQEFTRLDTDKNGQLSQAEFRAAARPIKIDPNAANEAMTNLDTNKDGKISADEYRRPILAQFDRFDTNKDGTISDAERKAAAARTASR